MRSTKGIIAFSIILIISIMTAYFAYAIIFNAMEVKVKPKSFEECANAGYVILETNPRQCSVPGVGIFSEEKDARVTVTGSQATEEGAQNVDDESIGIANPASVFCVEHDGEVSIRYEGDGSVGYCVFEDGSECEEWEFYHNRCTKGTGLEFRNEDCVKEGESGNSLSSDKCCEGFIGIRKDTDSEQGCKMDTSNEFFCSNCGDGICLIPENTCNCPEDCKG